MVSLRNFLIAANGPGGAISYEALQVIQPILMILMVLCAIGIIVVVLMQKGANDNMSAITGASKADSFYGKNKAQTKDGILRKATIGLSVVMLVISVLYFVLAII
ncbi:MAG TPA: preprotein translocase subunit SecG [Candidatus Faecicola pullistercoris]|nr:preprotein translocase subunit SecG [Candidatus Faecicola pullistercoris]